MQTKRVLLIACLLSICSHSWLNAAIVYPGSFVSGVHKQFYSATSNGSNLRDASGISYDPTNPDRLYLANHEGASSRRGIHEIIISTEAHTRVARTVTNNPFDVIVDSNGDIRTAYGFDNGANSTNSPSVRKTLNPIGPDPEVDSRMINSYGATDLNDPVSIAFVPTGFGGGFNPGEDVILFDQAYDTSENEGLFVVNKDSTDTVPVVATVYTDGAASSDSDFRGDASNVDGFAYFARLTIGTDLLGGVNRPFIERVKGDGVLQRMFLDIPAASMSQSLDNAMKVNQADGSVWLPIATSPTQRDYYRVDVANASDEGSGDFLAGVSLEITATTVNSPNSRDDDFLELGVNGMAFSPDGTYLAISDPGIGGGRDELMIFNLNPVPEPSALLLLGAAGLAACIRRRRVS